MADAEKARLERAAKLLLTLRELQAKTYEVTEEINKIIAGQDSMGDVLKRVERAFSDEFKARYNTAYAWAYTKDRPQLKRLIKLAGENETLARVAAYFADPDDYIRRARHPFGLFVARFNSLSPIPATELELDVPTVADCHHQPPCTSDQQHTQRKMADQRAGLR